MIEDRVTKISTTYTAEGLGASDFMPTPAQKALYEKMTTEELAQVYPQAEINIIEGNDDTLDIALVDPEEIPDKAYELVQRDLEYAWERWIGVA